MRFRNYNQQKAVMAKYSARQLERRPTLAEGQADDLKIDTGKTRVWLARVGKADGAKYEKGISVEKYDKKSGKWKLIDEYEG